MAWNPVTDGRTRSRAQAPARTRRIADGIWAVESEGRTLGYVEHLGNLYVALSGASHPEAGWLGEYDRAEDAWLAVHASRARRAPASA